MIFNTISYGQVAFPGAEGYGANSIGGRGGRIIKVTNLKDNGPGSFREAVTASGPRIVIFEVSGIINLESSLIISEPYLTIAGQTSPGGILITGYQTTLNAHNTIIRHMRFRVGSHRIADGADPETLDSFDIWGNAEGHMPTDAYNIIIDHCSFSWGVDETFSFAYNPRDITVQWSIISEGLSRAGHPKGEHSKGMLIWGKYSPDITLSLHHNYFASSTARQPLINAPNAGPTEFFPTVDVANCISYNGYGGNGMSGSGNIKVNWRHNYVKRGPETNANLYEISQSDGGKSPLPYCYVENNIGTFRSEITDPDWAVAIGWQFILQSEDWRRMTPWPHPEITTTPMTYSYALSVLEDVGATKPFRDEVDIRVIGDFAAGTGHIPDDVVYPDDFPTFQDLPVPTDTDNDGMPDTWETANGLNPAVADNNSIMSSGYTAIEEYINGLADKTLSPDPTTFVITLNTTGNGSISLNPEGGSYDSATTVSLTAIPDTGWQFDKWSGDVSGNKNPAGIVMDADKTVTAIFGQRPDSLVFQQRNDLDGIVSLEAENYNYKVSQGKFEWASRNVITGYSGTSYMQITPDNGIVIDTGYVMSTPRLDFEINFVKPGTHYIWIRGNDTDDGANSIHAGLNGSAFLSSDRIEYAYTGNWEWTNDTKDGAVASIDITSPGVHTLNIWMREDGVILDKIVLTTNADYAPTDTGPVESPRLIMDILTGLKDGDPDKNRSSPSGVNTILIYPNPFDSGISLDFLLPQSGLVELFVIDPNGRAVAKLFSEKIKSGKHILEISKNQLEHLSKGTYFLHLSGAGLNKTMKIIKQ